MAAASFAFVAGCSSEEDTCTATECVGPADPGDPLELDTPGSDECQAQCAHLAGCEGMNDAECAAVCDNAGFSADDLECIGNASCRGVELCLDLDTRGR